MVDALVKSPPTEPIRVCPACGDVMAAGLCASCAPPPARAYGQRDTAVAYSMTRPNSASLAVDSRRAATEWVTGPKEVDPHTRKAHPAQLKVVRPEAEPGLEAQPARGKRQTQIYRTKAEPLAAVARAWSLPEPDAPQTTSTARHARPASPLRQPSGPVEYTPVAAPAAPTEALAPPVEPEETAPEPQDVETPADVEVLSHPEVEPTHGQAVTVRAAMVDPESTVTTPRPDTHAQHNEPPPRREQSAHHAPRSFTDENETYGAKAPRFGFKVASIALAAGALVGIVVALTL